MTKSRTSAPFASTLPIAERMPARPDRIAIWSRMLVFGCIVVLWILPDLEHWALAGQSSTAFHQATIALLQSPLPNLARLIATGGIAIFCGELVLAAFHLFRTRRRFERMPTTYLTVRPLRPQSRKGKPQPSNPTSLWNSLHGVIAATDTRSWLAWTMSARPAEPVSFGVQVAAHPTASATIVQALRNTLRGHDAETLVEVQPDPITALLQPGMVICWQELRLTKPPEFLIATPDTHADDSLGALTAGLCPPAGVVFTEIQVIVQPRPDLDLRTAWRVFARRRYLKLRRKDLFGSTAEVGALEAKLHSEAYNVSVRLVAIARDRQHIPAARATLQTMLSGFSQFQTRSGNGRQHFRQAGFPGQYTIKSPIHNQTTSPQRYKGREANDSNGFLNSTLKPQHSKLIRAPRITPLPTLLASRLWAPPTILSSAEVAGLWHLPACELKTLINWLPNRHLPAPPHAFVTADSPEQLVLGYARQSDGREMPVGLTRRALRQVLHVTAGMGAGKTRLAANIARQIIATGGIIADGKGDDRAGSLAATCLSYVPLADEQRLVMLDVLDAEWPVGLNPLYGIDTTIAGGMTQAIGAVLALFARLDPETWSKSQGMQQYAQMSAALVAETVLNPTMAHLKQVLQDENYRTSLLPSCTNIEVRNFWEVTFPQVGEQQKSSRDALIRRLDNLMVDETTRYLLTQPVPTINLLDCLEQGRLVVIPLPHRTLGGIAEFVGMLIVQAIVRAAFQRPGDDQSRTTVPLIIDELQVFIGSGDNNDLRAAITQLRSFGIGGIYLHQTLGQLGTLRDEMLTNSANRIILRTQEPDASAYAAQFPTTDLTPADISGQDAEAHQYAVLAGGGAPAEVCSIRPLPWPASVDAESAIPPYTGPAWQTILPTPDLPLCEAERVAGAPPLETLICDLVYGNHDPQARAAQLAHLPDDEWQYLNSRWDAIRVAQRAHIIANPGCIPFDQSITDSDPTVQCVRQRADRRYRRQQWLSRLETRTPRVLAAAAYQRQRWLLESRPGRK